MKLVKTLKIEEVKLIEFNIFKDNRGFFYESFNQKEFDKIIGKKTTFVQDNHSLSKKGVLRGLHYQLKPYEQGKLVRVIKGSVFDVAVDIRPNSITYGNWVGEILSDENKRSLWIPEGFAHGFLTLSETAEFLYKTTNFYNKNYERTLLWSDKKFKIKWPLDHKEFILSNKDKEA